MSSQPRRLRAWNTRNRRRCVNRTRIWVERCRTLSCDTCRPGRQSRPSSFRTLLKFVASSVPPAVPRFLSPPWSARGRTCPSHLSDGQEGCPKLELDNWTEAGKQHGTRGMSCVVGRRRWCCRSRGVSDVTQLDAGDWWQWWGSGGKLAARQLVRFRGSTGPRCDVGGLGGPTPMRDSRTRAELG